MSYNETTQRYDEYPRSQFPGNIDNWANMSDVPVTMQPILAQYQEAWDNVDLSAIESLKTKYPALDQYIFNADKINQVFDGIKAVQAFFKDQVQDYITEVGQHEVGINDNPTDDEKLTASYSAYKIDNLVGVDIATNVSISASEWVSESRSDGFAFSYTYSNSQVLQTDEIQIFFKNGSLIAASKAMIAIDDNPGADGIIKFIARKQPTQNLEISVIKSARNTTV